MVVHDVDHDLHAARVDLGDKGAEILHRAVGGVDAAVVAVGVGTAEAAFLARRADRVDRHEPDDVRAEGADAVQVADDGAEGALLGVVADVDRVDDLLLQRKVGVCGHGSYLLAFYADPAAAGSTSRLRQP